MCIIVLFTELCIQDYRIWKNNETVNIFQNEFDQKYLWRTNSLVSALVSSTNYHIKSPDVEFKKTNAIV